LLLLTFAIGPAVLWAGGQNTTIASNAPSVIPVPTSQSPIRIEAGDLIDVQVFNTPELSAKLRVSQDGLITLPGASSVDVGGLTPLQAGATIEKSLRESQIMLDPHVTVLVTEYSTQGISVLGEVKKPGTYLLLGQHSLYDALSAAGGVTQQLGSSIQITHQSDPTRPITVPVSSPNYSELQRLTEVKAGDVVVVSRAETIYVVGDVGHPGEYYIQNGQKLSVLNAIALAQGVNPTAKATKASIVRKTATGAETIPVNLNRIAKNNGENLTLRAADVLVVPRSGAKQFLNVVLPGVTGAVAGSVAAALVVR
jgi:polysaccharide export outer membrane protein